MSASPDPAGPLHPARLVAGDEHDEKLLERVHPAEWETPEGEGRYHLVVIGGGTAGLVTAAIGSALGARVALVERGLMGGDCLNFGCVPSKALIEAANAWHHARGAADRYGAPPTGGDGDFARVMERMREIRATIARHDSAERFRDLGVDVYLGEASFEDERSVRVGDRVLPFHRAVVATGTRPQIPDVPGLLESGYRTNETIFSLTELPRRLIVLGGGTIGCELSQAFARLGSEVILIEMCDRVLPGVDPDAAEIVAGEMSSDGVYIMTGARVVGVRREGSERVVQVEAGGEASEVRGGELLIAAGRLPNIEALALERAGIESDPGRGLRVDDRMRTTNRRVFAIGDVASDQRFTHSADAQARLVVRNALFFGRGKVSDLVIPWCTYTSPEVAHVGVSTTASDDDTVTVDFAEVDRARLDGRDTGFLRIHLAGGSDRIIGATIVGEGAGELLPLLTHAVRAGIGLSSIADTIFPYPTRAEIIRKAADAWRRRKLTDRTRQIFDLYFRLR